MKVLHSFELTVLVFYNRSHFQGRYSTLRRDMCGTFVAYITDCPSFFAAQAIHCSSRSSFARRSRFCVAFLRGMKASL